MAQTKNSILSRKGNERKYISSKQGKYVDLSVWNGSNGMRINFPYISILEVENRIGAVRVK